MWYDDLKAWFLRSGERPRRRRPVRPPKAPTDSGTPAAPQKVYWRQVIDDLNDAIIKLEKNGADLGGYRVTVPPKAVCEMNDRIEGQLRRLGIPDHVHSPLAVTLCRYTLAKEIEDKAAEAAEKSGLIKEDTDVDEMSQEDIEKLWQIEGLISLQTFCRAIGVETDRVEAAEVVEGTRKWTNGEGA